MRQYVSMTGLWLIVVFILSCSSTDHRKPQDTAQQVPSPAYATDAELYLQTAQQLVQRFSKNLKSELMSALAEGNTLTAIEVCSKKAPELAKAWSGSGWMIKRVSDRNRNPLNRADTTELAVLAQFADSNAAPFLQSWTTGDSGTAVYRYYQPIRTMGLCLKCHGDLQTLAPGVYEALRKVYPMDKAVGYKENELRGMFVVESTWPSGKEFAEGLLRDSINVEQ